jgi:hypothetical protein
MLNKLPSFLLVFLSKKNKEVILAALHISVKTMNARFDQTMELLFLVVLFSFSGNHNFTPFHH